MTASPPAGPSPDPSPSWVRPATVVMFVVAVMAIKLVMAATTDLIRDEAYYTLWALYPLQGGYYDHPPALVWLIKAGTAVFGQTELAVRVLVIACIAPMSLAIHRTAMVLFDDRRIAALSVYWFNLTPGAVIGLLVITPDAPSMVLWMLAIWAAAELMRSNDGRWWIVFGLFAGLGLSAKYTGFFLGAGIVLWLLAHRQNRHWFASPWLYAGGALALLSFAPVIAWNLQNDWSSIAFQAGRSTRGLDASLGDLIHLPEFIAGQAALMLPWLFALVCIGFALFFGRRDWRDDPGLGLIVWTSVPALAMFGFHSLHSQTQGNWPWPLYAPWSILGAYMAWQWRPETGWAGTFQRHSRFLQALVGLVVALFIFSEAQWRWLGTGAMAGGRAMHGWHDVAAEMEAISDRTGIDTILVRDYGLYGALASYAAFDGHDYRTLPLNEFHRYGFVDLPENDDALDWPVLVAVPASMRADGGEPTARLGGLQAVFIATIERLGPHGEPESALNVFRLDRPQQPIFGRWSVSAFR